MNKAFENKLMVKTDCTYVMLLAFNYWTYFLKRDQKELISTFKCKVNCYCFRLNVINQC